MKPLFQSFKMFLKQISKDSMLIMVCVAPILAAVFFKFGIPYIEGLLCGYFDAQVILGNYYLLVDLMLIVLTPFMFCFASSMVMLTEFDENMTSYLAITPVGKNGYLISRLVFPAIISFVVTIVLLSFFSLTKWTPLLLVCANLFNCVISIIVSMLVVSFSHNRVEGMTTTKLSGLVMIGLIIPFFLLSKVQYMFSFLPSFWVAKLCIEENYVFLFPAIITLGIWLWLLYKKFEKKLV